VKNIKLKGQHERNIRLISRVAMRNLLNSGEHTPCLVLRNNAKGLARHLPVRTHLRKRYSRSHYG
jgi:hypothetical protein